MGFRLPRGMEAEGGEGTPRTWDGPLSRIWEWVRPALDVVGDGVRTDF